MVKKTKSKNATKQYSFHYKDRSCKVLLDKVAIFRILQKLHGRFWGVAAALGLAVGITICFLIRPDLFTVSTAISDFSMDVRTAPYFAGSLFFAAYGLWRWRNYLKRTIKRTRPILSLISLTILGLLTVALMPNGWQLWSSKIHLIGMALVGASAAGTVIADILLSKTRRGQNKGPVRMIKLTSFLLIFVGGWLTLGSSNWLGWFDVALPSEIMLIGGYFMWVILKTHQGEDLRSGLSKLLKKVILVN